jgi:hypothetical protein
MKGGMKKPCRSGVRHGMTNAIPTVRTSRPTSKRLNFAAINRAALAVLPILLARWVPNGKRIGREYVTLNPTRADRSVGSFKINLETGRWADFATGEATPTKRNLSM